MPCGIPILFARRLHPAKRMKGRGSTGSRSVDAYLAAVPPEYRAALQDLRETIQAAAPAAVETISYQIPAFRHQGVLVYYAAFKDHCSLFIGSVTTQGKFAEELKPFAAGKGTIHFTPNHPLPAGLVSRIVKARVAENEARSKAKSGKPASAAKRTR